MDHVTPLEHLLPTFVQTAALACSPSRVISTHQDSLDPPSRTRVSKTWPFACYSSGFDRVEPSNGSLFGQDAAHASHVTWLVCLAVRCGKHPYETCHLSRACYYHFPCHASERCADWWLFQMGRCATCSWPQSACSPPFWYPAICLSLSCLLCYPTSSSLLHSSGSPGRSALWKLHRCRFSLRRKKNITKTSNKWSV